MSRLTAQSISPSNVESLSLTRQALIVAGASLFVALCARVSLPLPFTPVPLTMSNFAVLAVGLTLGSRRGFAALCLYLMEGAAGLPVFTGGALGAVHFFGPTGGYLMAYPVVAFLAGFIAERGTRNFLRTALASVVAELALFAFGLSWLAAIAHVSIAQAVNFGLYPFVFAEVIKVMSAAGLASRLRRVF
jgi:biotin transport system substrate-specific component